jgi:hypothetical protein
MPATGWRIQRTELSSAITNFGFEVNVGVGVLIRLPCAFSENQFYRGTVGGVSGVSLDEKAYPHDPVGHRRFVLDRSYEGKRTTIG